MNYPEFKKGEHNILEGAVLPFEKLHRVFRSEYSDDKKKVVVEADELCKDIKKSIILLDYI